MMNELSLLLIILLPAVFILLAILVIVLIRLSKKDKQFRKKELLFTRELKNKSIELENALQMAEQSNQLKTAFLSNLSHEIRTPMNAIVGFSDLLINSNKDKKLDEYASIIRASSGQLLAIINDIIEMSMIETNQVNLHFTSMDINKVISEVCASFAISMDKPSRVEIRKNLQAGGENPVIVTDEVKFRQILSNLISNGIKFTEIGYVESGYTLHNDYLEFYVKDTGIGIDPLYHDEIFERFRRVEQTDMLLYRGLGIGLTLTQSYVKLLGGKIWLNSDPGRGSTFYFTIPYKKAAPENEKTEGKEVFRHHVILICEDDENNMLYFKELFRDTDTNILWASNGREAVEICRENASVELVLMDIKMPEMNGWEATKIIKNFRPDLPVIAQTAHALSLETNQFSRKGFDDYITKPIKRNELFEKISRFIHQ